MEQEGTKLERKMNEIKEKENKWRKTEKNGNQCSEKMNER